MELFQHDRTAYGNALAMMAQTGKAASIRYLDNHRDMSDGIAPDTKPGKPSTYQNPQMEQRSIA